MPRTTVVIPNWNGAGWIEPCLRSVQAQRNAGARIIVVDNASTDGSDRMAAEFGAQVIGMPENRGFAAAVNRGIAESETEFIAVVNNDAVLHPDWLATLIAALDHLPQHGMATGRALSAGQMGILDGAGDGLSRGFAAARLGHGKPDGAEYQRERDVLAVSGTAALFRRDVFLRAGAFEEAFFAYLEDVELCLRAQLAGFRARYVPDALAWHRGSASTRAEQSLPSEARPAGPAVPSEARPASPAAFLAAGQRERVSAPPSRFARWWARSLGTRRDRPASSTPKRKLRVLGTPASWPLAPRTEQSRAEPSRVRQSRDWSKARFLRLAGRSGSPHPQIATWITAHQLLMAARYARGPLLLPLLPRIVLVQLLWGARLVSHGRAMAWLRGLRLAAKNWKRMTAWQFPSGDDPQRLVELLRASEAQIFRDRVPGDRFWRIYFRVFPCRTSGGHSNAAAGQP